jgi:hypothetical protein
MAKCPHLVHDRSERAPRNHPLMPGSTRSLTCVFAPRADVGMSLNRVAGKRPDMADVRRSLMTWPSVDETRACVRQGPIGR